MNSNELNKLLNHISTFADKVGELSKYIAQGPISNTLPTTNALSLLIKSGFGKIQNTIDYEEWKEQYLRDIKSFENTIWHLTDIEAKDVADKTSEAKDVYVNKILPICEKFIKGTLEYNCEILGYRIKVK